MTILSVNKPKKKKKHKKKLHPNKAASLGFGRCGDFSGYEPSNDLLDSKLRLPGSFGTGKRR